MDNNIPPVDPRLVAWLDTNIPERCAKIDQTEREIFFYAGRRDLVLTLKSYLEAQTDDNVAARKLGR